MKRILEFIQSMFSPYGLKRFRYMTIFASVLIFILEAYVLFLPINTAYKNSINQYTSENEFTSIFYNVSDEQGVGIDGIKASKYYLNDSKLVTDDTTEGIKKYKYTYNYNNELYYVYLVFDVNGVVDKGIEEVCEKYESLYPNDSTNKKSYLSTLVYIKSLSGEDIDSNIEIYHASTEDDLKEMLNNITYKNLYGIEDSDNTYLMLFYTEQYLIECPESRITTKDEYAVTNNYDDITIDYTNITNVNDFVKPFAKSIAYTFIDSQATMYLFNCLMYAVVYTLIFAFFLYLFLHRRGSLRTFKEYYNILAITSIVPAIIGFALTWVLKAKGGLVYIAILTIYSTIFIYRVNAISDMDPTQK